MTLNSQTGVANGTDYLTRLSNVAVLYPDDPITGDNLPAGTVISAINPPGYPVGSIKISNPAPSNSSTVSFDFGLDFNKIVVVGVAGNDNFTSDGTVPNVILEGGSGTNSFNIVVPTVSLVTEAGSTTADSTEVTGLNTSQLYVGESAISVTGDSSPLADVPTGTTITKILCAAPMGVSSSRT